MGSQVDINTCTNACTHAKEGVGLEMGWLEHTHIGTQVYMELCNEVKQT